LSLGMHKPLEKFIVAPDLVRGLAAASPAAG
jgi:hypothetical protein